MIHPTQIIISTIAADEVLFHRRDLGVLLHACVHDGASIGFVLPFSIPDAEAFWTDKMLPRMRNGALTLLIARSDEQIVGSVQLDYDTPPNQPHRAEVRKLLVHPGFRRQGIAKALMAALERHASQLGRNLLTLDTRTGDKAEPLYTALGYETAGIIPGYCRDPFKDCFDPTTIMYKAL
ncbi:GNAT family N-acetyltransferase [Dongia deserti]|uniref:GNAT family N-acetyltransferase n=1 Tax=Dongia deserti TaxID=2268030 RepID=UPI000E64DACF|nr:GNAT family N-acetyltransferase [Dongia deserti]